ncbi:superoxide dismutase [Cu-Zn] [Barrientosiimonas marina]|uniref:Superoxide dismutase [Cu-Zn] n=1 Tax=Lentibacillus kimchii TaxID=1542911 RepID=A0ABW2UVJ8_9BACI
MKKIGLIVILLLITGCQGNNDETSKSVGMYNLSGDMIGTVQLSEGDNAVNLKMNLEGLEQGFHGIQVHEYAKCDPPDFKTAGNHFNPKGLKHGLMNPDGSHVGDLPNIKADNSGLVQDAELAAQGATLLDGKGSLLKDGGTSIIIHKSQDDGVSQPGGNAGERVACGLIVKEKKKPDKTPTDPTEHNEDMSEG